MSLGWLTESTLFPKKRKEIEGVSSNTLIELRAALFDAQQQAKKNRKITKTTRVSAMSVKNKGINDRAFRDLMEKQRAEKGVDSAVSLKAKAELYDKLMRGDVGDLADDERMLVDFERKQELIEQGQLIPEGEETNRELVSKDMEQDALRRAWERDMLDEISEEQRRSETIDAVEAEARKTEHARARVQQLRQQRKKMIQKRLQKIKQQHQQEQREKENQMRQQQQQFEDGEEPREDDEDDDQEGGGAGGRYWYYEDRGKRSRDREEEEEEEQQQQQQQQQNNDNDDEEGNDGGDESFPTDLNA